jgi:hypothetical protein
MKARLKDLAFTRDGESVLSITTKEDCRDLWDDLNGTEVEVVIKKHRPKRGMTQNGLYWATLSTLAHKLDVSNAYMHNVMIRRYGQPERFEDQVVYIMLPDTEEAENKALEAETYHLKPTSNTKDGKDGLRYRAYMLMRGSSTYNTEEFSRLLDGLISECKEAGVHVLTGREE